VLYIFSVFLCLFLLLFLSSFAEDLTVVRKYIYTIKIYCCCFFLAVFPYKCMTLWFLLMYFFFGVFAGFLILILAVVFFIVSFSRICYFGFCSILRSLVAWLPLVCVF